MDYFEQTREAVFVEAENEKIPKGTSEIQNYYANKTILVTGGTGFLGTLLIEKLLRCCSDLKKLIIILRSKRGKSLQQRADEHFRNLIYDKVRLTNPKEWYKKIEIVKGNCEKPFFDMEPDEWTRLQQEVNVIFHVAATIRFDEHIRISYNTNVNGTKFLLKLAEGSPNLSAFVYASTAYSQSHLTFIEENFYPTPYNDEQMMQLMDSLDYKTLACMTPFILDGRFNTYTLTKSMAENVISAYVGKLPVAVFRPSIVTPTLNEPIRGWTNSIAGATGIFVGTGVGFLRTLYCHPRAKAEIIPADRVINAFLTIPLHLQKKKNASIDATVATTSTHIHSAKNHSKKQQSEENFVPIYNYTAKGKTIDWHTTMEILNQVAVCRDIDNLVLMWYHHLILEKSYTLWVLQSYLIHVLPIPVFVLMEKILKLPPRVWKGYIRLFYYTNQYSFFMLKTWNFAWKNTAELIMSTSEYDKILFNADNTIDWNIHLWDMLRSVPFYLLKLDWNVFDNRQQRIKSRCIKIIDNLLIWTFKMLSLWLIVKIVLNFISLLFG